MNGSRRRALVLGATGHLGNAIVRDLLAQGWQVRAATRQPRPAALEGLALDIVQGDIEQDDSLAAWVPGCDWVIDAAAPYPLDLPGLTRLRHDTTAQLERARRRTARLIEHVAREGASLGFVSSFTTLPRPQHEGLRATGEAWLRRRAHPYFAVKAQMEGMVLEAARGGLRAVVVNPSACLGPWDRRPFMQCAVPLLVTGQVPVLMSHGIRVVDVRDVARVLREALTDGRFGTPIAIGGHASDTLALARRVCALAGVSAPRLRLPGSAMALGAWVAEAGLALIGQRTPLPSIAPMLVLDGGAAPSTIGPASTAALRPLDQTLADSIAWYRSIGYC